MWNRVKWGREHSFNPLYLEKTLSAWGHEANPIKMHKSPNMPPELVFDL